MHFIDPIPNEQPPEAVPAETVTTIGHGQDLLQASPIEPVPGPSRDEAVVDLVDVALVTLVAFFSVILCGVVALAVVYSSPGARNVEARDLARDALVIIPAQFVAYLMVVAFMVFIVAVRHGSAFLKGIQWNMPGPKAIMGALGGGAALALTSQLFSGLLQRWIPKTLPIDQYFKNPASGYLLAAFGVLVAPFVEEFFFRGFLYPALARWTGAATAIVLTAAGFSLLHQDQLAHAWAPLLILFVVGMVLTAIRAKTRSVATSVLVHMGYNATLFTILFFYTQGFRHMERLN